MFTACFQRLVYDTLLQVQQLLVFTVHPGSRWHRCTRLCGASGKPSLSFLYRLLGYWRRYEVACSFFLVDFNCINYCQYAAVVVPQLYLSCCHGSRLCDLSVSKCTD